MELQKKEIHPAIKIPTVFQNKKNGCICVWLVRMLLSCFSSKSRYCRFCSIWICWSSNETAALSISSDCDNFKIVHFILAVNNSFLLLLLLLFWWVFLNLMLFAFFCFALCSESWAHGLHIFSWLRHLCVQSTVINLAIKIELSTPSPSSSLVRAMSTNCHHCFVGVLLVMLSSFWKCKRLCYQTLSSPSYVIELHLFDNECHQTIFWSKLVFVCWQYNSMVA